MRITGGELRGRSIKSPPRGIAGVRPTMDALRESLFTILDQYIDWESVRVADLYAGSGSLGLESISRGAKQVKFVESNRVCVATIKNNIEQLVGGCSSDIQIHHSNVISCLKTIKNDFSLVFADPPFGDISMMEFLDILGASEALLPDAIVVFEDDSKNIAKIERQASTFLAKGYEILRVKKYSAAGVCISKIRK